jgi:hypothetical protein
LKTTIIRSLTVFGLLMQGVTMPVHAENTTSVEILSATVRDQKVDGASVIVQRNGEQSVAVTTDSQGRAPIQESVAQDPAALIIVRKAGYSDLVAKCPCVGMTYAISPVMYTLDGVRIVLNWGANPRDLDAHLSFPGNHIAFSSKLGADAQLDVDHLDGFGPETITIARRHPGERYVYAVHDFWDRQKPQTPDLSASGAKVFVYIGQTLVRTYYVPTGRVGNIWTVFAISEDGELQDINTMSGTYALSSTDVTASLIFHDALPERALPARVVPEDARKLNTEGEAAYHSGDYARAMQLFQAAIAIHDGYGQAYSNLGLVFQKSGRIPEALWANRKAIALAAGPNAATTRASTHFNNGRIYEDKQLWEDAQCEYLAAQNEQSKPVYATAIARAEQHGAHQP